jgi:hypothetical protein
MNIIYYNESSVFDELSSDEHYLIAIDSNLVSTHQVELPKMSLAKAKKAIPFLLEDTLLDDIEDLDFFVKKIANTQYYEVIVMGKQIISELQEKIEQVQLSVERCVVDFMLLPNDKEKMHYIEDEQGVLFRFGEFLGGRMDKVIFDESLTDEYQLIGAAPDIINFFLKFTYDLLTHYNHLVILGVCNFFHKEIQGNFLNLALEQGLKKFTKLKKNEFC